MKIGKHLITFSMITLITVLGFTFTPNNTSRGNSAKEINSAECCPVPCDGRCCCRNNCM